jgi:DNA primase
MEIENFTYPEALRHAAKKYGIEIEEDQSEFPKKPKMPRRKEICCIKFMKLPIPIFRKSFGK